MGRNFQQIGLVVSLLGIALALPALAQLEKVKPYQPKPVTVPKGREYLTPQGAIMIVGNDGMEDIVKGLNALFVTKHPGFKFINRLEGSSTGLPGLTAGVSALAPMARDATKNELKGFTEMFGYQPLDVHIGYSGHGPRANGKTPPSLYISKNNPLKGLTLEQLARIYTTGNSQGDITTWGQLGLTGEWQDKPIHLYGGGSGGAMELVRAAAGGRPVTKAILPQDNYADALMALEEDPYGIAFTGWVKAESYSEEVRLVPLSRKAGEPFTAPDYQPVWNGKYPISISLRFYCNRVPGRPLDPFIKEYLRLALSREGQQIIYKLRGEEDGYVPLTPSKIASELVKLN